MKSKPTKENPGIVFLQIAVQMTGKEVGGFEPYHMRMRKLAVAVLYCSALDDYRVYTESQVGNLLDTLKSARFVVGYNCLGFDYEVLRGHSSFQCPRTLDLYQIFRETMGFGVSLDNMASSTLGGDWVSDGNADTALWKAGKVDAIIDQCKQDVDLMCRIYKHGMDHKSIGFTNAHGQKITAPIQWKAASFTCNGNQ